MTGTVLDLNPPPPPISEMIGANLSVLFSLPEVTAGFAMVADVSGRVWVSQSSAPKMITQLPLETQKKVLEHLSSLRRQLKTHIEGIEDAAKEG